MHFCNMTYQECLDFLYGQLPMYQREGAIAFKKDLTNIRALCAHLGHPQDLYPTIHVAGTNGKGSVCHMLAAILHAGGYKVGLYTSPHYFDFRERIKINGEFIAEQEVLEFVTSLQLEIARLKPSFFELTVAMAFNHFAKKEVDFAVIETGLGGRLDSTNIVKPLLSVITNISYDHQTMLGSTLPQIATEKAGIIKNGVPVVVGERQAETDVVFLEKATRHSAPIHFADDVIKLDMLKFQNHGFNVKATDLQLDKYWDLTVGLSGIYQVNNLKTALAVVSALCQHHDLCLPTGAIKDGLHQVSTLSALQGRWQIVQTTPLVIVDSGHNVAGLALAMQQLKSYYPRRLHLIFGVVKDKPYKELISLLPSDASYYWCAPALSRALEATNLAEEAKLLGLKGMVCKSVKAAIREALSSALPSDVIFIGGSTFVVGEALSLMTTPVTFDQ